MRKTSFLKFLGCVLSLGAAQANAGMPGLSVQLWSVHNEVKADMDKALSELAGMGFEGVEFAGEFGPYADNPAGLKQRLTQLGLVCSGAHVSFDSWSEEKRYRTLAFYQALGCPTLIVPGDGRAFKAETVGQTIADLNRYLPLAKAYGFAIGYHNHAFEFATIGDDKTLWDEIARNTSKEVVLQQDVGWSYFAGKDPAKYVRAYPGRTLTTHYKAMLRDTDKGKQALIGKDGIDWQALLSANIEVGGTHWLVVEQESSPDGLTPMQAVKLSKQGLEQEISKWQKTH